MEDLIGLLKAMFIGGIVGMGVGAIWSCIEIWIAYLTEEVEPDHTEGYFNDEHDGI